ncbi:PAS domain S-box protein [Lutibacter flavus]|uniref:histidine kinase n=1 Tax=Lutibacter flavus TaxID=691689 RepID=A0A238XXK3_9FLAO|nr:PAS domain S-box protein [Lutibacter flavus]SNR63725.1 PAS domain-containing protein [Lutibacter flavus]
MRVENNFYENLTKEELLILLKEKEDIIYSMQHDNRKCENIFNNSLDGIYKSNPNGKFIVVNTALVEMLGYDSKEELLEINIKTQLYLNLKDREGVIDQFCDKEKEMHRVYKKDGSIIWIEDYGRNIYDDSGNILYYEGIIRNVTDIKRANDIQEVLLNISQYGYEDQDLKNYNEYIINQLGRLIDVSNSYIAFYNNENQTINIPFVSGENGKEDFPVGKSLTGFLIKGKKPLLIKSEEFQNLIKSGEVELMGRMSKVWLGVPLELNNVVIGAIVLQSYDDENAYKESDIDLLKFVSSQICLAIGRKRNLEELAISKEVLRKVLDNIPVKVFWKNKESKFLGCNVSFLEVNSFSNENEVIGKTDFDFNNKEDAKKYRADDVATMLSGKPKLNYHTQLIINGTKRWVTTSKLPFFDENNNVIGIIGTSEDITERKEGEIKLKKAIKEATLAKEILRKVLDNIPIRVFWKDKESRFLGCNKCFYEALSFKSDKEVIGKTDYDLNSKKVADITRNDELEIMNTGIPKLKFRETFIDDGEQLIFSSNKLPFVNQNNEIIGIIGTSNDITERVKSNEKLKNATDEAIAANLSKSTFLSNMSHEIRTPMNAILGYSQLLQEDDNLTKVQQENLKTINKSGEHLLALINDILDMSKIEAGRISLKLSDFNFTEVLKEVEQLFRIKATQNKIDLSFNIEKDVPKVIKADESKIKQVIINLVGNAIKFTKQGFVQVSVSKISNGILQVNVKDSGQGILKEEQETIFKPFEQAQNGDRVIGGTGLGLAISKKFSNLMNGDVVLESELGKGSTFSFNFEYSESLETILKEEMEELQVIGLSENNKNLKIAIVDDRFENRDILFKKLNPLGFDIKMAENGKEAVELYEKWKPDIILMDVVMPIMNGIEATRRIFEISGNHNVKIIVVSASALESEQKEIMDLGATVFIKKPVIFNVLLFELQDKGGVDFIYEKRNRKIVENQESTPLEVPLIMKDKICSAAAEGDFILLQNLLEDLKIETNSSYDFIENCINEMEFEEVINWFKS